MAEHLSSVELLGGIMPVINAEYATGATLAEMRANISPEMAALGDARLMWVNEADLMARELFLARTIPHNPLHDKESETE